MVDRAHYLARTMIARLANLRASFAEDGRGEPDRRQRIDAIAKVLAVELGVTDGALLALIESAVPHSQGGKVTDREVSAFADFLRVRLAAQLEEA